MKPRCNKCSLRKKRFKKLFVIISQGWDFAHRFSERIAGFLRKNEQMSYSLMAAHFW